MFADELVDRLILPSDWQHLSPQQLADVADDVSPLPAREWLIELARERHRVATEAGLLENRDETVHRLGEARYKATEEQIEAELATLWPKVLGKASGEWLEALSRAAELRAARGKLRQAAGLPAPPSVTDWAERAVMLKGNPAVGRPYAQLWQAEHDAVGDGSTHVTPEQWARIVPHVSADGLQRIDAVRARMRAEIETARLELVDRLQMQLDADKQAREGIRWPDPPPPPRVDADRCYLWGSPWHDGELRRTEGGGDWEGVWHVWADVTAALSIAAGSRQVDDPEQLAARLGKRHRIPHRPPIDRADLEEWIGELVTPRFGTKRRVFAALQRMPWQSEVSVEWTELEGVTYRGRVAPPGEAEHDVIELCRLMNAEWVERPLQVPRYKSWATIDPCKTLRYVERDESGVVASVEYTPHGHEQTGPFSERGLFAVYARNDERARSLIAGFGGQWADFDGEWPTPRFARVPIVDAEPSGLILHGLTGVENAESASDRLRQIIDSGGLASIATRRQRRTSMMSLSPLGDIGSGIDGGVPCKIGREPSYGKFVYFVMRPETIERRDVWFSDCDFGGGVSRYDQYNEYAQSIGHERFWLPPSAKARRRHYEWGCGDVQNEVWFADRVDIEEIEAIYATTDPAFDWLEPELGDRIEVTRFSSTSDLTERLSARHAARRHE